MRLFLGLFAAAASLATSAAQGAPSCRLQQLADLPLSLRNGRLFVYTQINGRPARMIVSTGAFVTRLSRPGAAVLDLKVKPISAVQLAQVYGIGAVADAAVARVETFQLGALVARHQDMLVAGDRAPGDAEGVLGMDFLEQADLEFDVPAGRLRVFRPGGCKGDDVVYWGKAYSSARMVGSDADRSIGVTVQVNGVPVVAELDTGYAHSVMAEGTAENAEIVPRAEGVVSAGDSSGPAAIGSYAGIIPTFAFGDETIHNAKVEIADPYEMTESVQVGPRALDSNPDRPAMVLGADFFRAHRVYVAMGQRTVYISYVGGPVFQTAASASRTAPEPTP